METEELFSEEDKDYIIKELQESNRILSYKLYNARNEDSHKSDLIDKIEKILYVLERIEKKIYEED